MSRADHRRSIKRVARRQLAAMRYMSLIRFTVAAIGVAMLAWLLRDRFSVTLTVDMIDLRSAIAAIISSLTAPNLTRIVLLWALEIVLVSPLLVLLCRVYLKFTADKSQLVDDGSPPELPSPENFTPPAMVPFLPEVKGFAPSLNRALALGFQVEVRVFLWQALLVGLPTILMMLTSSVATPLFAMLILIGTLVCWVIEGRYYPAFFYAAQGFTVAESLREARTITRGRLVEFLVYKASFLPWYILCILTFGFGLIFVVPYRMLCDTLYVRRLDVGL